MADSYERADRGPGLAGHSPHPHPGQRGAVAAADPRDHADGGSSRIAEEWKFDHGIMVPLAAFSPRVRSAGRAGEHQLPGAAVGAAAPRLGLRRGLRRAADRVPQRMAVIGTGGISHWPATPDSGKINEAWDRELLRRWAAQRQGALLVVHGLRHVPGRGSGRLRDPHLHQRRRGCARPGAAAALPADSHLRGGLHHRHHGDCGLNRNMSRVRCHTGLEYSGNLRPRRHERAVP